MHLLLPGDITKPISHMKEIEEVEKETTEKGGRKKKNAYKRLQII